MLTLNANNQLPSPNNTTKIEYEFQRPLLSSDLNEAQVVEASNSLASNRITKDPIQFKYEVYRNSASNMTLTFHDFAFDYINPDSGDIVRGTISRELSVTKFNPGRLISTYSNAIEVCLWYRKRIVNKDSTLYKDGFRTTNNLSLGATADSAAVIYEEEIENTIDASLGSVKYDGYLSSRVITEYTMTFKSIESSAIAPSDPDGEGEWIQLSDEFTKMYILLPHSNDYTTLGVISRPDAVVNCETFSNAVSDHSGQYYPDIVTLSFIPCRIDLNNRLIYTYGSRNRSMLGSTIVFDKYIYNSFYESSNEFFYDDHLKRGEYDSNSIEYAKSGIISFPYYKIYGGQERDLYLPSSIKSDRLNLAIENLIEKQNGGERVCRIHSDPYNAIESIDFTSQALFYIKSGYSLIDLDFSDFDISSTNVTFTSEHAEYSIIRVASSSERIKIHNFSVDLAYTPITSSFKFGAIHIEDVIDANQFISIENSRIRLTDLSPVTTNGVYGIIVDNRANNRRLRELSIFNVDILIDKARTHTVAGIYQYTGGGTVTNDTFYQYSITNCRVKITGVSECSNIYGIRMSPCFGSPENSEVIKDCNIEISNVVLPSYESFKIYGIYCTWCDGRYAELSNNHVIISGISSEGSFENEIVPDLVGSSIYGIYLDHYQYAPEIEYCSNNTITISELNITCTSLSNASYPATYDALNIGGIYVDTDLNDGSAVGFISDNLVTIVNATVYWFATDPTTFHTADTAIANAYSTVFGILIDADRNDYIQYSDNKIRMTTINLVAMHPGVLQPIDWTEMNSNVPVRKINGQFTIYGFKSEPQFSADPYSGRDDTGKRENIGCEISAVEINSCFPEIKSKIYGVYLGSQAEVTNLNVVIRASLITCQNTEVFGIYDNFYYTASSNYSKHERWLSNSTVIIEAIQYQFLDKNSDNCKLNAAHTTTYENFKMYGIYCTKGYRNYSNISCNIYDIRYCYPIGAYPNYEIVSISGNGSGINNLIYGMYATRESVKIVNSQISVSDIITSEHPNLYSKSVSELVRNGNIVTPDEALTSSNFYKLFPNVTPIYCGTTEASIENCDIDLHGHLTGCGIFQLINCLNSEVNNCGLSCKLTSATPHYYLQFYASNGYTRLLSCNDLRNSSVNLYLPLVAEDTDQITDFTNDTSCLNIVCIESDIITKCNIICEIANNNCAKLISVVCCNSFESSTLNSVINSASNVTNFKFAAVNPTVHVVPTEYNYNDGSLCTRKITNSTITVRSRSTDNPHQVYGILLSSGFNTGYSDAIISGNNISIVSNSGVPSNAENRHYGIHCDGYINYSNSTGFFDLSIVCSNNQVSVKTDSTYIQYAVNLIAEDFIHLSNCYVVGTNGILNSSPIKLSCVNAEVLNTPTPNGISVTGVTGQLLIDDISLSQVATGRKVF